MQNLFTWVDYIVVAGTLLFSIFIGLYYACIAKQQTNEDLLVGGRKMGIAPIACSMLVTYLSAIHVLGYPAEIYAYGIQIFMSSITYVIVVPFSVYFFMTVFYQMQLTSVYEYLEKRYDSVFVRWLASFIFILQMSMYMGVCLFAPSIALSAFMGIQLWQSVVGLGLCATIYTSIGGLRAVVWTDVFQLMMILAGMLTIIVRGFIVAGGIPAAFTKANEHGRLQLFDWSIDPFMRHNTLNIFLGQAFTIFCLYGTHQPQVQRYCSVPTLRDAIKATVFAIPLNMFTVFLCLLSGIVIFSSYAGCDPFILGDINRVDGIVPYFVIKQLSFIPGMMGLFTACVFSASLSTLSSGLNSIAAVVWEDFLGKITFMKNLKPKNQAHLIRFIAIFFGIICIGLAFLSQNMGAILSATITALGALSGPLGAIFAMGLLCPQTNKYGAIIGMVSGFFIMGWITTNAFILGKSHIPLPFSVDDCPDEILAKYNATSNDVTIETPPDKWPEKLYTISYIMYPFIGGVITFIIGLVASLLTGGIKSAKDIDPSLLHPLIRKNKSKDNNVSSIGKSRQNNVDRLATNMNGKSGYEIGPLIPNNNENEPNTPETPLEDLKSPRPLLYRMGD